MAKAKTAARKRRPYEYGHEYGLTVAGKAGKARKISVKKTAKQR